MDSSVLFLLELCRRLDSVDDAVVVSSVELGDSLGVSQQTVSRQLIELERRGLIERRVSGRSRRIKLTSRGVELLGEIRSDLDSLLGEGKARTRYKTVEGSVVTGLGEGAYYVKAYSERIQGEVGFRPYPGTLNLRITETKPLPRFRESLSIESFTKDDRTYGKVTLAPVRLQVKGKPINDSSTHVILPERTHHRDKLEVVSRYNLRRKHGIRDDDVVELQFK